MDGAREPGEQLDRRFEGRGEDGVHLIDLALGDQLYLDVCVGLDGLLRPHQHSGNPFLVGQPQRNRRAPCSFLPRPRLHPGPLPRGLDLGDGVRQRVGGGHGVLAHPRAVALRDRNPGQEHDDQVRTPLEPGAFEHRIQAFVHRLESSMHHGSL